MEEATTAGVLKRYYSDEENDPDSGSESEGGDGDTTTTDAYAEASSSRDEVKEIEKAAMRDTIRVRCWRLTAFVCLCITAVAITYGCYHLLEKSEIENFETAFRQFSRTVADAAITRQVDVRDSLDTFVTLISNHAKQTNQEWPFVTLRSFEDYGQSFLKMSHAEVVATFLKVEEQDREDFINYTYQNSQKWVEESHVLQKGSLERLTGSFVDTYKPYIAQATPEGMVQDIERDVYWPNWQYSPPPASYGWINFNVATVPDYGAIIDAVEQLKNETLVTKVRKYTSIPLAMSYEEHDRLHSQYAKSSVDYPHSMLWRAIHEDAGNYDSRIVGMVGSGLAWDEALLNLLPEGVTGIHVDILNDCDQSFSYSINGPDAIYLDEHHGHGHEHEEERRFEDIALHVSLTPHTHPDLSSTPGHCQYEMKIYPTSEFESAYHTSMPGAFAALVAVTFGLIAVFFFGYDTVVQRMNRKLIQKAARSNEVLAALIPEHLRDRLVAEKENTRNKGRGTKKEFKYDINGEKNLDNLLDDDDPSRPMADLYLETTVLYADISGFTAWSSIREPIHVFTLLENIFQAFDLIAKKRRIFKVETVGDCYVAVTGLPEPRPDHAVAMVRFARDIVARMRTLAKQLETTLGPDTGELALRVGIHSGPVTGGVLRGDRTRFQLFGDTMNTASAMESGGRANKIHCSKETAELIKKAGKGDWLVARSDAVHCKGIGSVETFFVTTSRERGGSVNSGTEGTSSNGDMTPAAVHGPRMPGLDEKTHRLIEWNVEMLLRLIKQIVARREASKRLSLPSAGLGWPGEASSDSLGVGEMPLDEVKEIISLPSLDETAARKQRNPDDVEVPEDVVAQLHHYVSTIATMYNGNPFHNFSHASHVVMSVVKLMSRIVAPSRQDTMKDTHNSAESLHDHTYGITSDPLTQFACAYSGLIHDVDHQGVSNAQLVKEDQPVAKKYRDRTVAEQNSFDLSWDLLMKPEYEKLRRYLFPEKSELVRFRQLVVNSIMSTDIADKELKNLRNDRWEKAFSSGSASGHEDDDNRDNINRKATIVIEHIIQASDVSHTMQHWHVYRKWNQNLFEELYVAYLAGRLDNDPTTFWYKGEFGFFDFYIIPLTCKLKECGVFGVSSEEYLQYAMANRAEWEARGEKMVKEMSAECRKKYGVKHSVLDMVQEDSVVFV